VSLTIVTNNVPREVLYGYELSAEERAEFDYIDWVAVEAGTGDIGEFVRYKGTLYDLGDVMSTREILASGEAGELRRWDGYVSDSYFSGVLFRWPREGLDGIDSEHVICGRYYS